MYIHTYDIYIYIYSIIYTHMIVVVIRSSLYCQSGCLDALALAISSRCQPKEQTTTTTTTTTTDNNNIDNNNNANKHNK